MVFHRQAFPACRFCAETSGDLTMGAAKYDREGTESP